MAYLFIYVVLYISVSLESPNMMLFLGVLASHPCLGPVLPTDHPPLSMRPFKSNARHHTSWPQLAMPPASSTQFNFIQHARELTHKYYLLLVHNHIKDPIVPKALLRLSCLNMLFGT